MEQEGAMNSSEYHKCMSEVYFTRALMWMLYAGIVLKLQQSEFGIILAVASGALSTVYFYWSFREFMGASNG
jgi:hypothetical protein